MTGYISSARVVRGTDVYGVSNTTITVPTAPLTAITNTSFLANFTNAGIYDNSMMNNLETVGNAQVSTSVVKYGTGSMAFDGTGDYLTLLSTQLLTWGTGDFTIEMWVNTSTTSVSGGASRTMWGTSSASYQGQMYLEIGTGKVVFGNTGSTFIKGSKNVADGAWHHIAVCRNGTTCRLFVDGVQDASGTNSVNYDAQVTYVGAFGPSDGYFNGYLVRATSPLKGGTTAPGITAAVLCTRPSTHTHLARVCCFTLIASADTPLMSMEPFFSLRERLY